MVWRCGSLPFFRGFLRSDFKAFAHEKRCKKSFDNERGLVYDKLLSIKKDLDPLLKRRKIKLEGSVSDYWITAAFRKDIGVLWLRYPEPKGDYTIPHLEISISDDSVFVGITLPKHGRTYQANLVEYAGKKGLDIVKRISHLPSHKTNFAISNSEDFYRGHPRDIGIQHVAAFARSHISGQDWINIGYHFGKHDPRVRSFRLVSLTANIFSHLYWLYEIASKEYGLRTSYARRHHMLIKRERRPSLRPFEKKRARDYSRELGSYKIDLLKKEKALKAHRQITNRLADTLQMQGCECRDGPHSIDLVCQTNHNTSHLFEVKSCNESNIGKQIRTGISQLYEYRYFILKGKSRIKLFLVTQVRPSDSLIKYLENDRNIGVLWLDRGSLRTTAKSRTWLSPIHLS